MTRKKIQGGGVFTGRRFQAISPDDAKTLQLYITVLWLPGVHLTCSQHLFLAENALQSLQTGIFNYLIFLGGKAQRCNKRKWLRWE